MQMALPERMNRLMEKISLNLKQATIYTYVGTTRKWELKSQGPPSTLHCCPALEVTLLQFTPTPTIVYITNIQ